MSLILRDSSKWDVFSYIAILSTSLLVWWVPNFLVGGFIYVGDTPFPLTNIAIDRNIDSLYYIWNMSSGTGQNNMYGGAILYYLFIFILYVLGLSLWVINRIVFVLPLAIWGWTTYYLSRTLIHGEYSRAASTIAGIFIVLSPAYAPALQNPQLGFGLSGIPLLLAAFLRGMRSSNDLNKTVFYAFLASIATLLVAQSHPTMIVLSFGTILLYMPLHIFLTRSRFHKPELRFLLITVTIVVLMNFYWLFPFLILSQQYDLLAALHNQPSVDSGFIGFASLAPYSSLLHVSRLIQDHPNGLGYYFRASYMIIIFSLALPVYAYLSLVIRRSGETLALASAAIILTLFSTGAHYGWFASVYKWLWGNIFLFQTLNNSYYYVSVLSIFYAVLIGITFQTIMSKSKLSLIPKINFPVKKLPALRILALVVVTALIISNGGMSLAYLGPSYTINYARIKDPMVVPSSYDNLMGYLVNSNAHGFILLVLPFQGYLTYKWFPGPDLSAGGVLLNYSPLPVVQIGGGPPKDPRFMEAVKSIDIGDVMHASKLLAVLSVKYILVSKDLASNNFPGESGRSPGELARYFKILNRYPDLFVPLLNTPEYTLYELQRPDIIPFVFAALDPRLRLLVPDIPVDPNGSERVLAPSFDEGRYIEMPKAPFLNETGSVVVWIRLKALKPSNPTIVGFKQNITSDNWRLFIDTASGNLATQSGERSANSGFHIEVDRWYYIAVTASSSELKFFVNGIQVDRTLVFKMDSTLGNPLLVGYDGWESYFSGEITNLQIYGKALENSQVLSLYDAGIRSNPIRSAELLGWWPLDDLPTNGTVPDLSGRSYNGYAGVKLDWIGLNSWWEEKLTKVVRISQTEYLLEANSTLPLTILMNTKYDPNWLAFADNLLIHPTPGPLNNTMVWKIPWSGPVTVNLRYQMQVWVFPSYLVSTLTAFILISFLSTRNTKNVG